MDHGFYEILLPQLKNILRDIEALSIDKDLINKYWNAHNPLHNFPEKVYGVDGGSRSIELKGSVIGIITAIAIGYMLNMNNGKYSRHENIISALITRVLPPRNSEERISLYREVLEGKVGLHACKDGSLILFDGSISSVLIPPRPRPGVITLSKSWGTDVDMVLSILGSNYPDLLEKYVSCIDNTLLDKAKLKNNPLCSIMFSRYLSKNLYDKHSKEYGVIDLITVVMEYIEKLYTYANLFKQVHDKKCSILFIAKRSYSSEILGIGNYPDMLLFDRLTKGVGFSKVFVKRVEEIKQLPSLNKLITWVSPVFNYYKKLCVYEGYARLDKQGPVLKIDVLEECGFDGEKIFAKYIDMLVPISIDGYPFPLKTAHLDSHISYEDLKSLMYISGLNIEPTGREVLEY